MKFLDRFKRKPPETRASTWDLLQAGTAGVQWLYGPHLAENLSTVSACVSLIASSLAALPCYVYRVTTGSKTAQPSHPVQRLIDHGANSRQSWFDLVQSLMADVLLQGNGLAVIDYDGRGAVRSLEFCPWRLVLPVLLSSGRLRYDVSPQPPIGGRLRRMLEDEVVHVRDRSDDGVLGRSRLARAHEVIRLSLQMQTFGNALYENSAVPSGVVEIQNTLTAEQMRRLRESFMQSQSGASKAGKILVLDNETKWKQMTISPDDAEFLASRRFSVDEVCRLYDVPPPLVGSLEHATLSNVESLIRLFLNLCLGPWVRKLESTLTRALLAEPGLVIEFDVQGFARGDVESRWTAYEKALKSQVLTPNEVREMEGWNPRAGGDAVLTMPGQTTGGAI